MKGSIYVIRSHQTKEVYIGSTTQILCKRMADHRKHYKLWLNGKHDYVYSYNIIQYDDAYIELLEEIDVQSKQELQAREGYYIRTMDCVNKRIEGRTKLEWREDNKEHLKEKDKEYRNDNKEHLKEKYKEYYQANKEHLNEKQKEYYQANKEKINEKQKEKYTCECGIIGTIAHKSTHLKSQRHKLFISNE